MIQSTLRDFGLALRSLDVQTPYNVYHYWRPMMEAPFIVWQETGETEGLSADNKRAEAVMRITVDVYTKTEFDDLLDKVYEFLNDNGIAFVLDSVDFEETTKVIHYRFNCELAVTYGSN